MNFFQFIHERIADYTDYDMGKEHDRKRHVDKSETLFAYISCPYYS